MNFTTIMSAKEANVLTSEWISVNTEKQIKEKIEKAISIGEYRIVYNFLDDTVETFFVPLLKEKGYILVKNDLAKLPRTYIISWEHIKE